MGEVEEGARFTLEQMGIKEPRTLAEKQVIYLAQALDSGPEEKNIAGLNRELRLTLEEVRNQPEPSGDFLTGMQDRQ